MSISGRYVKTFAEANLASMIDVHMNGDYDFFYDVQEVKGRIVTVKSHKDGAVSRHRIVSGKEPFEYFIVIHSGVFQKLFESKPERIKVVPFKGERS